MQRGRPKKNKTEQPTDEKKKGRPKKTGGDAEEIRKDLQARLDNKENEKTLYARGTSLKKPYVCDSCGQDTMTIFIKGGKQFCKILYQHLKKTKESVK